MCGGFTLYDEIEFGSRFMIERMKGHKPQYNIRPSHFAPVIFDRAGKRNLELMRFGMVPVWAKDTKIGYKMFNARSETIFNKPTWKRPAKTKRCLIPANGFFEWQKREDGKHPLFIHPKDQKLFSFAGLYDHWKDPATGQTLMSFAIITTTPNREMEPVHDRMPVILNTETEKAWLSDEEDQGFLNSLLKPYPDNHLAMYEVSTEVNSAKNQGSQLIVRV